MTLCDQQARDEALDVTRSFIVQAPAGSGKTETLVQRYLALLAYAASQPDEVLAITFTRKAANEMRGRVIHTLQAAIDDPDSLQPTTLRLSLAVLEKDKAAGWYLLNQTQQCQIKTIDSLCASLCRSLPVSSQFVAYAELTTDPRPLYQQAVAQLIASEQKAVQNLLLRFENRYSVVERLLMGMLASREQWLPYLYLRDDPQELRDFLDQQASNVQQQLILNCERSVPQAFYHELLALIEYANGYLPEDKVMPMDNPLSAWQSIATILLTTQNRLRKTVNIKLGFPAASSTEVPEEKVRFTQYKERMLSVLAEIADFPEALSSLAHIRTAPDDHYTDRHWELLGELFQILPFLVAQLKVVFSQQETIDYTEMSISALNALGSIDEPSELAMRLGHKINHILVDEFQDTSVAQYRLLESLTQSWQAGDGHSLFLVGDPMQSIYAFRAADVGLFLNTQTGGFGQLDMTALQLTANFRSDKSVIDWINQHFSEIFPDAPSSMDGAVSYHASIAQKEMLGAQVQLHAIPESDDHKEAARLVSSLQEFRSQHPNDTTAVLVRARAHLIEIMAALDAHHIPYQAVEFASLIEHPLIQDCVSLSCALVHQGDRLAWLSLLRSPLCGLTLTDLHHLANTEGTIWQACQNPKQLSEDGKKRLQAFTPLLSYWMAQRGRVPLSECVMAVWQSCQADMGLETQLFFEVLDEIDASTVNVRPQLNLLLSQTRMDRHSSADNPVQLMTIHKSKGLEFDCVFLPQLHRATRSNQSPLLLWQSITTPDFGQQFLFAALEKTKAATQIYDYLNHVKKTKLHNESIRLFYVAATRAKKQLHCSFQLERDDEQWLKPASGSLLALLWPAISDNIVPCELETTDEVRSGYPRLRRPIQLPEIAVPQPFAPDIQKISAVLEESIIGTVLHECFEQFALMGLAQVPRDYLTRYRLPLQSRLLQLGLPVASLAAAMDDMNHLINAIFEDARADWIFSNQHTASQAEYVLETRIDDQVKTFILDRTFVDQGVRWIIDYKTGGALATDQKEFIAEQVKLHRPQLEHYAALMQAIDPTHPIRLGLYFPRFKDLEEWCYDSELVAL